MARVGCLQAEIGSFAEEESGYHHGDDERSHPRHAALEDNLLAHVASEESRHQRREGEHPPVVERDAAATVRTSVW